MQTKHKHLLSVMITALIAANAVSAHKDGATKSSAGSGNNNPAQVDKATQGWPKASREAIQFLQKKYGAPAAVTADMVVWGKAGPWKRSVVYRVEVPHNFPMPHTDVMQQWIEYKAAPSTYDELAQYDGSVVLERTSGEMSARCDKEGANFLALNLADEIVRGKISVDAARKKYGDEIMAMKAGKPAPYMEKLLFSTQGGTQDPDKALPMK